MSDDASVDEIRQPNGCPVSPVLDGVFGPRDPGGAAGPGRLPQGPGRGRPVVHAGEHDLDPLRARDDFRKLLADLEAQQKISGGPSGR
jgi:hypothetical protein